MRNGDGKPHVLIVEDHLSTGLALERLLEFGGFRAILARSGADAFRRIAEENLDAAIIDVRLPDINGWALANVVRTQFGRDVAVVIISGDDSTYSSDKLTESGADLFFRKPLNQGIILERLEGLLQR